MVGCGIGPGPGAVPRDIDGMERLLAGRGLFFVRERFRIPARPGISAAAGFAASAAGASLVAAGRPGSAFLTAIAGAALLLLDACGFSPLDWAGPKRRTEVLVIPGAPSQGARKALFVALPLACGPEASSTAGGARLRSVCYRAGMAASLVLAAVAGGSALVLFQTPPAVAGAAGACFVALAASEARREGGPGGPPNTAVLWAERLAAPGEGKGRPFVLLFPGDGAEVKFFLARYRGELWRGQGIIALVPEGEPGPPQVGLGEGPFVPCRTERGLLDAVRAAARDAGAPEPEPRVLRSRTPGLYAAARGFRAVTILRLPGAEPPRPPLDDERACAWLRAAVDRLLPEPGPGL